MNLRRQVGLAAVFAMTSSLTLPAGAAVADSGVVPVIITERAPATSDAEAAVRAVGGEVGRPLALVDGFAATVPADAESRLRADPHIAALWRDGSVRA